MTRVLSRIYAPVYLFTLVGIVVAAGAWLAVLEYGKSKFISDFGHKASERFAAVENRIVNEMAIVNTLVAYITLQSDLSREDFNKLIRISDKTGKEHAYQALEWIPRVPRAKKDAYESAGRQDGYHDYQFKQRLATRKMGPVTLDRAEYFPVHYVYPYKGNEGALGFDLGSNPARLDALELARDSNSIVASARINLVQSPQDPAGVLVFSPVYKNNADISDVENRRQNLLGFALGVFHIGRMVDTALNSSGARDSVKSFAGIDLYLFDAGTGDKPEPVYVHSSSSRLDVAPDMDFQEAREDVFTRYDFLVGGRTWTLIARPISQNLATTWYIAAAATAAAILLITLLSAMFIAAVSQRNQKVRILVDQRTAELKDASQRALISEERVRAVVETVVDGIITFDTNGIIETINPAATTIFQCDEANLIGSRIWLLLAPPWQGEYEEKLTTGRQTGEVEIVGKGREIEGLRRDGSEFPLAFGISEMTVAGQRKFTSVVRDITDQKLAEKMKSEFVSTVSHELRTPLTSIKGSLGLVRSGIAGDLPENLKSMLEIAYKNSERLVLLINDILDIEKIEAGKMDFHFEPLDLAQLVSEAASAHDAYASEFGVRIELTIPQTVAKVRGDQSRLMQVMANLLSNATKFSGDSDVVEVSLALQGRTWRLSVADHGGGIPQAFREKIFQRFSQADSSDTRQSGGTGLGLSICQAIIGKHGGIIDFTSRPGEGSTFYFELPAFLPVEVDPSADAGDGRILVCEDDLDVSLILAATLHQNGFATDIANTAAEARDLLNSNGYLAMTLDLGLPDQDGISLLKELRTNPSTRDLPVIVVSASAGENARLHAGNSFDVIDWIDKPVDTNILTAALERGLRGTKSNRPRVLHIEDNNDILAILSALARDLYDVVSAENLATAKELLLNQTFDLVILDLALPDGSGEEILPLLNLANKEPTPVIIFSASETTRDLTRNVKAALVKSRTTNEDLLATVHAAIKSGPAPKDV